MIIELVKRSAEEMEDWHKRQAEAWKRDQSMRAAGAAGAPQAPLKESKKWKAIVAGEVISEGYTREETLSRAVSELYAGYCRDRYGTADRAKLMQSFEYLARFVIPLDS